MTFQAATHPTLKTSRSTLPHSHSTATPPQCPQTTTTAATRPPTPPPIPTNPRGNSKPHTSRATRSTSRATGEGGDTLLPRPPRGITRALPRQRNMHLRRQRSTRLVRGLPSIRDSMHIISSRHRGNTPRRSRFVTQGWWFFATIANISAAAAARGIHPALPARRPRPPRPGGLLRPDPRPRRRPRKRRSPGTRPRHLPPRGHRRCVRRPQTRGRRARDDRGCGRRGDAGQRRGPQDQG